MSEWALKRFWENVTVIECDGGFSVRLDDRTIKTPARNALVMPTQAFADQVAVEWEAQTKTVDPMTMPWTRSANAALDKVTAQRGELIEYLADYAGTDLLSYRSEGPDHLVARQAELWDPILDWAMQKFDVRIAVTQGIVPVAQDAETLVRLAQPMEPMSDFQLTGFYDLVTLSGSFILALAATNKLQPSPILWAASQVDEDWQTQQWGEDEEAMLQAEAKKSAFLHATEVFHNA